MAGPMKTSELLYYTMIKFLIFIMFIDITKFTYSLTLKESTKQFISLVSVQCTCSVSMVLLKIQEFP